MAYSIVTAYGTFVFTLMTHSLLFEFVETVRVWQEKTHLDRDVINNRVEHRGPEIPKPKIRQSEKRRKLNLTLFTHITK